MSKTNGPAGPAPVGLDPVLGKVVSWWERERRHLPWRSSRDVYRVWVAEVMSVQTSVRRAADYWERWMSHWPTVESLSAASLREVLAAWQGLGYPRRARDLHRSAQIIAASGWPEDLQTLPGVGPYVAAAIRCFAREEPVLPRDVNVNRVLARRFPAGIELGDDPWRVAQAVMEFGQRICTRRPDCGACPVRAGCPGPEDDRARPTRRQGHFAGSLRQRRGRLLAQVLASGWVARADADPEAAMSLLADGLLDSDAAGLIPPG